MSEAAGNLGRTPAGGSAGLPHAGPLPGAPRTYVQTVARDTLAARGAQAGMAWLAVIVFCAVLAPFLANSHPYAMKTTDGQLHFPLFRHLTPTDVILPLVAAAAGALFIVLPRWSLGRKLALLAGLTAVVSVAAVLLVKPPLLPRFEEHRTLRAEGKVAWAITTPVPFSPRDRQRDLGERRYIAPALAGPHRMGTEGNGADVLARMIHAARIALAIGFIATGIQIVVGVIVGGVMGYFSGVVDLIGMRLVEIFSAIPTLFLLLTLIAVLPPEWNPYRLYVMMVIIGLTGWVGFARFTRAEFLRLRQQDFVQAAVACGLPLRSVLFRHMLPNGVAPVLVEASFGIAGAIITESVLSFLGLGLVDEPSWGQMLSEAVGSTGSFNWWMAVFPGTAIFLTVFAYNLVGESLRDAIDPHLKKAAQL